MARSVNALVLDAALDEIALAATLLVCAGQPTDRADALTKALADETLTGADFTKANGDVSGRKVTVSQQADITIDTSGTADHVALIDATNLLYVTVCTSQELTSAGTVTVPAWKVEILAPAAP